MMPSEPDKKMEELLRTYARKRREDAGEPPEMHPATRRLLQAEAAKLRPREANSERTLWSWLQLRWPRVAIAAGAFALLAVAIWNAIPDRGQSSTPALLAKNIKPEKAAIETPVAGGDRLADSEAQLGARFEQDKDRAKRLEPEAMKPTERSRDEFRVERSLREAGAQADVKLKQESEALRLGTQPTPAGGLKYAEAEAAAGVAEKQSLARKLDAGATPNRSAADLAVIRPEPPAPSAPISGVNPAQTSSADPRGKQKQLGLTYSAPGGPTVPEPYFKLPLITQTSPPAKPAQFLDSAGGPGRGAERQPTDFSFITPPAAPSPNTSSPVPGFDSRNNVAKGGRADFGAETRDGAANLSLNDRSQARARGTGASAGGVPIAAESTRAPAPLKQYVRFKRQDEADQLAVAKTAKTAKESAPASLLSTFDFEQEGDRVRVIDSDGSVYSGRFVTGAEVGQARVMEPGEELNRPALAGAEPRRQSNTSDLWARYYTSLASGPSTTNRLFRANGTNRTLGQLVTIEALLSGGPESSIIGDPRRVSPAPTTPSPSARPAAEAKSRVPASATVNGAVPPSGAQETQRLVGRVLIGASNELKLIAVPVAR